MNRTAAVQPANQQRRRHGRPRRARARTARAHAIAVVVAARRMVDGEQRLIEICPRPPPPIRPTTRAPADCWPFARSLASFLRRSRVPCRPDKNAVEYDKMNPAGCRCSMRSTSRVPCRYENAVEYDALAGAPRDQPVLLAPHAARGRHLALRPGASSRAAPRRFFWRHALVRRAMPPRR